MIIAKSNALELRVHLKKITLMAHGSEFPNEFYTKYHVVCSSSKESVPTAPQNNYLSNLVPLPEKMIFRGMYSKR